MTEPEKTKKAKFMLLGMFLGLAFGTVVGVVTGRVGLWLPVGYGLGASLGFGIDTYKKHKEKPK